MKKNTHLSELAEQNPALLAFYNRGQGLLRFPAIVMPGVVSEFMKNDSEGVEEVFKSTSVPENKQCHPD